MKKVRKTISFNDLDRDECIGIGDATLAKAKKCIDDVSKEHLRDMVDYFLPQSDEKDKKKKGKCSDNLSVVTMKKMCNEFLYSEKILSIVSMLVSGFNMDMVEVILSRENKVNRVVIKNPTKQKMSDAKLKQIAQDLYSGKIFCNRQIRRQEDIGMVFMPLLLMSDQDFWVMQKNPPGLVYEYMHKAGPRSINGYPVFMSCYILSQENTKRMIVFYEKLCLLMDDFEKSNTPVTIVKDEK